MRRWGLLGAALAVGALGCECKEEASACVLDSAAQDSELDSAAPDSALPDGAAPDSALPDGAAPDGAVASQGWDRLVLGYRSETETPSEFEVDADNTRVVFLPNGLLARAVFCRSFETGWLTGDQLVKLREAVLQAPWRETAATQAPIEGTWRMTLWRGERAWVIEAPREGEPALSAEANDLRILLNVFRPVSITSERYAPAAVWLKVYDQAFLDSLDPETVAAAGEGAWYLDSVDLSELKGEPHRLVGEDVPFVARLCPMSCHPFTFVEQGGVRYPIACQAVPPGDERSL